MTHIIDGRKISRDILDDIKKEVATLSFVPVFCDILVGEDKASIQYVNLKKKKALELGIDFYDASFPVSVTTEEILKEIEKINNISNMSGIIVQLPLPATIDTKRVLDAIDPNLDVDCLGSFSNKKFYEGKDTLGLPTALACIYMLESLDLDLSAKDIVVLGYGELVGKPVFQLLTQRGYKPKVVRSQTETKEEILKNADVIISGMGQGHYLKGEMIKKGVILIDAGTSELGNSLVGDVDLESVRDVASVLSPVPGGVGPVTVAMLFRNVLEVAKQIHLALTSPYQGEGEKSNEQ